mmetsp:Transcript_8594/g.17859  ORF Transcript_8594/g.17859 Transcript_8594/m.17859 type:complete len:213 (-) Transcript_8594:322-960(-)
MYLMDRSIPLRATSTRCSAFFAVSRAGRISRATPMAGKGLISAPIQKARSDGWSEGGISPMHSKSSSIWPGERSFSVANSIHRSTKLKLLGMFPLGMVSSSAFMMARAMVVRSYSSESASVLDSRAFWISSSSSCAESRNFTVASVYPSSPPTVLMLPSSIWNRRWVALSANLIPCPSGRNSSLSFRISTSTPLVKWICCPLARRAIPSIAM